MIRVLLQAKHLARAKKLSKMNPNKSPGPDGAAPRVLKELQVIIAEPLYLIFRESLDLGER
jgi:hypothetical protein